MINIVFSVNDKYAEYCSCCIASILKNHKVRTQNDKINFTFLYTALIEKTKENLVSHRKIQDFEYSFRHINLQDYQLHNNLPLCHWWTVETYYRLLIPELFKNEKIIYLDCDIIVNIDIQELWNVKIDDYHCAVCEGNFFEHQDYFNAGVMIFNNKKLNESYFPNKFRQHISQTDPKLLPYLDQDILNQVLCGMGGGGLCYTCLLDTI
jgi:lipopolysaccharide biosynthesis glycosyltransferase